MREPHEPTGRRSRPSRPPGLPAALLSGLAIVATPAAGQLPASDSAGVVPLDSIQVTALRTPLQLGRTPFSISVLGPRSLSRGKAGFSLEEAVQGLPGVEVQNRFNPAVGERITIRGFGSRSQFGVRGITVVVDGIPATLPDGQSTLDHLDLGSLGRVEALRGPASAVYGNGSGGVMVFETREPPDAPFVPEARGVLGSDGASRVQGTAAGRTGGWSYLWSLGRTSFDGFRTNPAQPSGDPYGRSETFHLNGTTGAALGGGRFRATVNLVDLDAENPGSIADSVYRIGDRQAHGFNIRQRTGKEVRQGQLGLSWDGPLGGLEGSLAVYGISRDVENPIPNAIIALDRVAGGLLGRLSGSVPLERPGGALRWSAGVQVDAQRDDRLNFENDAGDRGAETLDQLERVRSLGLFTQVELPLGERVDALAGVRYDRLRFRVEDRFAGGADESGQRTMDAWSPSVGLHLAATPSLGFFANVASSFETPTTTELANRPDGAGGFNPELEPQRGFTVEGGVRGRRGSVLAMELSVFATWLEDELVPFEVPSAPGRTFFRNAGSSRRRGLEAALTLAPLPWLGAQLTYSVVDGEFTDYEVGGEDLSGNDVPGFAPRRFEGLARVERGLWYGELRGVYVDEIPVNDAGTTRSDSYWLADLRTGLARLSLGGLELAPFAGIDNLFDDLYVTSVVVNAFGRRYFEPGPGRTWYAGASVAWPGR